MKQWWYSYWSKLGHENKSSIANDEATLLDERLEFFVPKLRSLLTPWQWLLYVIAWSLFLTVLARFHLPTWGHFIARLMIDMTITALTLFPGIIISDYLRPKLKRLHTIDAGGRIVMILVLCAMLAQLLVMLIEDAIGWASFSNGQLFVESIITGLIAGGFTLVYLLYFLHRHQQLIALKLAFDQKLAAQNDLIKARIAPHFFFNTINTLMSLVESNPEQAAKLLQHISALFRASFNGPKDISFEEEVALCEHYLAIESCRLAGKLKVSWQVPDADTMYDMVITALTLQRVLEQILQNIVEMTTETIYMAIVVTWQYHRVNIQINVQMPKKTLFIKPDIRRQMNFQVQSQRLQLNFGESAYISSQVTQYHIATTISYPLHDAGL